MVKLNKKNLKLKPYSSFSLTIESTMLSNRACGWNCENE